MQTSFMPVHNTKQTFTYLTLLLLLTFNISSISIRLDPKLKEVIGGAFHPFTLTMQELSVVQENVSVTQTDGSVVDGFQYEIFYTPIRTKKIMIKNGNNPKWIQAGDYVFMPRVNVKYSLAGKVLTTTELGYETVMGFLENYRRSKFYDAKTFENLKTFNMFSFVTPNYEVNELYNTFHNNRDILDIMTYEYFEGEPRSIFHSSSEIVKTDFSVFKARFFERYLNIVNNDLKSLYINLIEEQQVANPVPRNKSYNPMKDKYETALNDVKNTIKAFCKEIPKLDSNINFLEKTIFKTMVNQATSKKFEKILNDFIQAKEKNLMIKALEVYASKTQGGIHNLKISMASSPNKVPKGTVLMMDILKAMLSDHLYDTFLKEIQHLMNTQPEAIQMKKIVIGVLEDNWGSYIVKLKANVNKTWPNVGDFQQITDNMLLKITNFENIIASTIVQASTGFIDWFVFYYMKYSTTRTLFGDLFVAKDGSFFNNMYYSVKNLMDPSSSIGAPVVIIR